MRLVYFSHSYRKEDAAVVRYFGELIRNEGLVPVLDPPSETVNAARLQRHLRDSDGMVVVLTNRDGGVSPHILFEATLCLQARKPLLVFVEDNLSVELLPRRVLRSRFSRQWFFRQIRDHRQAVRLFLSYLGVEPPPRYQPSAERRTCLVVGISLLGTAVQQQVHATVEAFGYGVVAEKLSDRAQDQSVQLSENLACADLVVEIRDSQDPADQFVMGAVRAAFLPRITLTCDQDFSFDPTVPREYQPRIVSREDSSTMSRFLSDQFELYEQAFIELDTPREVSRYVDLLLDAANPLGEYASNTRHLFIQELTMGDQYKVGQAGAVGPNAHAHDIQFQQIWSEAAQNTDLAALASELARLRVVLKQEAQSPEQDAATGEVALAEIAAKGDDGPQALVHLKNAGRWVLSVAERIGVGVATAAIKTSLGV